MNNGDGTFTLYFTDGSSFRTPDLTGPAGAPGAAGAAGPNWIAAMGYVYGDPGNPLVYQGHNVNGITCNIGDGYYIIDLAFTFNQHSYVVLLSDADHDQETIVYWESAGDLCVRTFDDFTGTPTPSNFSFCLLRMS